MILRLFTVIWLLIIIIQAKKRKKKGPSAKDENKYLWEKHQQLDQFIKSDQGHKHEPYLGGYNS